MGQFIDLTGQRFGRWAVIRYGDRTLAGQTRWLCRCDCGTERLVQGGHLRGGRTQSCGCLHSEKTSANNRKYKTKHGGATHTHRERLYKIYMDMRRRCEKENAKEYSNYGGRGITVCEEWSGENGYINFRDWSFKNGYDPKAPKKEMTLDRIDNERGYSPDNCRWASYKTQANNRRNNRKITIGGETHTISEWADKVGIDQRSISSRLYNGWPEEDAVMKPIRAW